jgi:hypothetical protein
MNETSRKQTSCSIINDRVLGTEMNLLEPELQFIYQGTSGKARRELIRQIIFFTQYRAKDVYFTGDPSPSQYGSHEMTTSVQPASFQEPDTLLTS